MLEYEKNLGFDKKWEKMQSSGVNNIFEVIVDALTYFVVYLLFRWIFIKLPIISFWNNTKHLFSIWGIPISVADVIYFVLGFAMYLYASIRLVGITKENHTARKSDEKPSVLLTDGYYSKARHPMYGVFVLRFCGAIFSVRSIACPILGILFGVMQYLNGAREEKKTLCPLFGEEYNSYKKKVRNMLLQNWELLVLALWVVADIVGLIIK